MTARGRGFERGSHLPFMKQILSVPCDMEKKKKKTSEVTEESHNEGGLEDFIACREER